MKKKLIVLGLATAFVALSFAYFAVLGLTPVTVTTVLGTQDSSVVTQEKWVPFDRYLDFSFRMSYEIKLIKATGETDVLFKTDNGSISDRMEILALQRTNFHQVRILTTSGQQRALVQFQF